MVFSSSAAGGNSTKTYGTRHKRKRRSVNSIYAFKGYSSDEDDDDVKGKSKEEGEGGSGDTNDDESNKPLHKRSSMVASKGRKRDLKDGNNDSLENKYKVCAGSATITTMKEKQTSSDESSVEDNKSKKISPIKVDENNIMHKENDDKIEKKDGTSESNGKNNDSLDFEPDTSKVITCSSPKSILSGSKKRSLPQSVQYAQLAPLQNQSIQTALNKPPKQRQPLSLNENLQQIKINIYKEVTKVHRSNGAEKLFSQYWDNVQRYLSIPNLFNMDLFLKSFLKTKVLRRLHNQLILSKC